MLFSLTKSTQSLNNTIDGLYHLNLSFLRIKYNYVYGSLAKVFSVIFAQNFRSVFDISNSFTFSLAITKLGKYLVLPNFVGPQSQT